MAILPLPRRVLGLSAWQIARRLVSGAFLAGGHAAGRGAGQPLLNRVLLLLLLSSSAWCDPGWEAVPDRRGDYHFNGSPVPARRPGGGCLWQVVVSRLRLRSAPGLNAPVVATVGRGEHLTSFIGRGGSDEVLQNRKDAAGNFWMWVLLSPGRTAFVRANSRLIRPLQP